MRNAAPTTRLALEAAEQADDRNGATHYSINLANVLADQGRLEGLGLGTRALVTSRWPVGPEGLVMRMERRSLKGIKQRT